MNRKARYQAVMDYFRSKTGEVTTELEYGSTFQLLIAVVLSAQCTDKRINQVTPALFRRFPDARSLAEADEVEVYEYIKSVSYPNAKARNILRLAQKLRDSFDGEVPQDMNSLLTLPGVGRKTANVILSIAFGQATIAVDTHVYRVSHRLGLVSSKDDTPLKVEQVLTKNVSEADLPLAHHWLLLHGRYVCTSKKPHCEQCGLSDICPKKLEGSKLV